MADSEPCYHCGLAIPAGQGDAHGIARDQRARRGDGDMKILTDLGQQAHDDEFRGANAKGTGGQGQRAGVLHHVLTGF